jgi:SAM-dependent methyltransferase
VDSSQLTAPLGDLLTPGDGGTLFIGRYATGLRLKLPRLRLVLDPLGRPRKLAQLRTATLPVLRADPRRIPLPDGTLGSVVTLDMLGRMPDPAAALAEWARVLADGGTLVVVEPLANGAVPRALRRLAAPSRRLLAPEEVTGLMLNCGLAEIGQRWPAAHFISAGRIRTLPGV